MESILNTIVEREQITRLYYCATVVRTWTLLLITDCNVIDVSNCGSRRTTENGWSGLVLIDLTMDLESRI